MSPSPFSIALQNVNGLIISLDKIVNIAQGEGQIGVQRDQCRLLQIESLINNFNEIIKVLITSNKYVLPR